MTTGTNQMPQPGEPAPDFGLLDDEGQPRGLPDARGSWLVLYFYPKDDTPGCTIQACSLRDAHADIVERGARVWGISIGDSSGKADFKRKHELPFTLLADEDHAVAEEYGAWTKKTNYGRTYWGVQRSTFLIDPEGVIRRVWPTVKAAEHAREVLDALDNERRK